MRENTWGRGPRKRRVRMLQNCVQPV